MRILIVTAVLLLITIVCLGWHQQQRLTSARQVHDELTARAAARGMSLDAKGRLHTAKSSRPDRLAEARQVAGTLVAYVNDMESLNTGNRSDPELRARVMTQTEQLTSLNREQLEALIEELRHVEGLSDLRRSDLILFCFKQLARDHPQSALRLLTVDPDLLAQVRRRSGYPVNTILTATADWARRDFQAALDWYRDASAGSLGAYVPAMLGLLVEAAERDPQLALSLLDEFGYEPERAGYFSNVAHTREQRLAMATVLREWRDRLTGDAADALSFDRTLGEILLGNSSAPCDFDEAADRLGAANLSPAELEAVTRDLRRHVKRAEAGPWLDWVNAHLPPEAARDRGAELLTMWSRHDPQSAVQWALQLPAGEPRTQTLQHLYRVWPRSTEAERTAAEEFAAQHGLQPEPGQR